MSTEGHQPSACEAAMRLLLVEDDVAVNESLAELLNDEGFVVTTKRNGAEALEALKAGEQIDIVLLDLMMPVMTGTEFLAAARVQLQQLRIPVVVISAVNDADCILPKEVAFVRKPFNLDQLLDTLRRATRARIAGA